MIYANKDRYEGQWIADKKQGKAVYILVSGMPAFGIWENDKRK